MGTPKVANKDARGHVKLRMDFNGSNLYGRTTNDGERYVVFSYGPHYPMLVYDNGVWYSNADKYSVSTSKQYGQVCPCNTVPMETDKMRALVVYGIAGVAIGKHELGEMTLRRELLCQF
jgi:hypothetical protein